MTLIEILVVMVLVALMMTATVAGSGQLAGARLKHAATALSGSIRVAFSRATATSKNIRIVFDFDEQKTWLEEGDIPMLVQSKDRTGTGGANAVTSAERQAIDEGERLFKGPRPPRPAFHPIASVGISDGEGRGSSAKGPQPLPRGIKFREIQSMHDDAPRTSGRAYLYFWPGGLTERSSIQLRIGDSTEANDTLSLMVSPLTGKVTVKNGPVALTRPVDDTEASERTDTGGF